MSGSLLHHPSALHLIRMRVDERADEPAVTFVHDGSGPDGESVLTYGQLDAAARRTAAWLQRSCTPGDRAMLLDPTGTSFAMSFLGCLYAGVIAVPSPMPGRFGHQQRRVTAIAADAGARVALTSAGQLDDARQWAADEGLDLPVAAVDEPGLADPAQWQEPSVRADDLALLQYTSGSTGDPKGVMVSHGNLLHNVDSLRRAMGFDEHTRFGGWIPLYHDMGLMGLLLPGLFLGGGCVSMSPMAFLKRPHRWLELVDRYRVDFSAAPDFGYELCLRKVTDAQAAAVDLSGWRHAANGSEPIQAATLRAFAERFAASGFRADAFVPCYGMAEATVFVSGLAGRSPRVAPVAAGALEQGEFRPAAAHEEVRELVGCGPARDAEARIVEPGTGRVLPDGAAGEIWLRGASIAAGYWNRPEATAAAFGAYTADGDGPYLRTGDLGVLADGELYVTGRIKDLIIVHGRNLYPHDIEYELRNRLPQLAALRGAVFSVPAPHEEIVVLHEIRGRLDEPSLSEISRAVNGALADGFGVRAGAVVLLRPGHVLKTTSGKVRRSEMRRLFLDGALEPVHQHLEPALRDLTVAVRS